MTGLFVLGHVAEAAAPNTYVCREGAAEAEFICIKNLEGTSNGQDAFLAHSKMSISP